MKTPKIVSSTSWIGFNYLDMIFGRKIKYYVKKIKSHSSGSKESFLCLTYILGIPLSFIPRISILNHILLRYTLKQFWSSTIRFAPSWGCYDSNDHQYLYTNNTDCKLQNQRLKLLNVLPHRIQLLCSVHPMQSELKKQKKEE